MKKIGLDFGTTNSILSYYNPETKTIECYNLGGVQGNMYIPSFVSVEKGNNGDAIEIGNAARCNLGDSDFRVFSRFKMLLGERDKERLRHHGYVAISPAKVAQTYIATLLRRYIQEQNVEAPLSSIVITVPYIWAIEGAHAAREELKTICTQLNLPSHEFCSEPVAATAYFVDRYRNKHGQWFDGHVLVCDYGGGTLDLSLSRIEKDQVTVLECSGKGQCDEWLGRAGVAFDHAMVQRISARDGGAPLEADSVRFHRLNREFEERKIEKTDRIAKLLERYLKESSCDDKVFLIDGSKVLASDLAAVFDELIKPPLVQALEEMRGCFTAHGIDWQDANRFRVVMVGGFSGFYLVRRTVMKFFEAAYCKGTVDPRFDSCFALDDTALAIAKGAALIANKMVDVAATCPISVGLRIYDESLQEQRDLPILQKGIKISEYRQPRYLVKNVSVSQEPELRRTSITIFLGDQPRRYLSIGLGAANLLPNVDVPGNRWELGFAVNDDLLFSFHARDALGTDKVTELGRLLEKMGGLVYTGEGGT